jgi:hypothetical protein
MGRDSSVSVLVCLLPRVLMPLLYDLLVVNSIFVQLLKSPNEDVREQVNIHKLVVSTFVDALMSGDDMARAVQGVCVFV